MLPYYIYKLITKFIRPFIAFYILIRISKGKEDKTRIAERYGTSNVKRKKGKVIWFHAASIGESLSILPLLSKLNSDKSIDQIILTTGTVTSANILKSKLSKKIIHQYIPFDVSIWCSRFLNFWKPNLILWIESDIWPNMLNKIREKDINCLYLNARISPNSFKKWQNAKNFYKNSLKNFNKIFAQSTNDKKRIQN